MIACELISALLSGDFVRKHPLVVKVAMIAIKAAIKIGAAQLAVQIPSASLEVLDSMTDSLLTDTLAIAYEEEAADSGAAGGAVDRAFMKRDIGVTVEAMMQNPSEGLEEIVDGQRELGRSQYLLFKEWLDTKHPGWKGKLGLEPVVQPGGSVEWLPEHAL